MRALPLLLLLAGCVPLTNGMYQPSFGNPVFAQSECIGAVVNGECSGTIMPTAAYHQNCYGQVLNGICTGPMF